MGEVTGRACGTVPEQHLELTQEALASKALIARHLITKIETESNENPTLESLDRLASALGVSTEAFFNDLQVSSSLNG